MISVSGIQDCGSCFAGRLDLHQEHDITGITTLRFFDILWFKVDSSTGENTIDTVSGHGHITYH